MSEATTNEPTSTSETAVDTKKTKKEQWKLEKYCYDKREDADKIIADHAPLSDDYSSYEFTGEDLEAPVYVIARNPMMAYANLAKECFAVEVETKRVGKVPVAKTAADVQKMLDALPDLEREKFMAMFAPPAEKPAGKNKSK